MYCDLPVFTRCCICMPLRRGVLTFGYLAVALNMYIMIKESINIHNHHRNLPLYQRLELPDELTVTLDCVDIVFGVVLIIGAHLQRVAYVKAYFYYSISTFVLSIVLWVVDFSLAGRHFEPILIIFVVCVKSIQIYLLFLIRSLIQKLSVSKDHKYENPLERIVYGEGTEVNGVYNNITVEGNTSEK